MLAFAGTFHLLTTGTLMLQIDWKFSRAIPEVTLEGNKWIGGRTHPFVALCYTMGQRHEAISLLIPGTITTPTFPVLCRQPRFSLPCLLYNDCIISYYSLLYIVPLVPAILKKVSAALTSHLGSMLISLLLDKTRSYYTKNTIKYDRGLIVLVGRMTFRLSAGAGLKMRLCKSEG